MATITLGVGTSHGPLLNTPPQEWGQRARADRNNPGLVYRGREYSFEQLREVRGEDFTDQCRLEIQQQRHAACREAIARLGEQVQSAELDALVVVSSDHKEVFGDELLAPFSFYWGEAVAHEPFSQADLDAMPPGLAIAEVANVPQASTVRACHAELALHLIKETSAAGFDAAASEQLPAGRYGNHGIPHGWGFIYQQLLGGSTDVPFVPVFVNTFWQPNPPSPARCYDFGVALGEAIESYPDPLRVGVVASGGLSHFVVDEELDRDFLDALINGDRARLAALPAEVLQSGSSEMRNWIVAGAAVSRSGLGGRIVDYQPCYRSEAGTGCAMGFVLWDGDR